MRCLLLGVCALQAASLVQWPPRSGYAPKVLRSHPTAAGWTRKNAPIDARRLNSLLSRSTTAQELLELHGQHGPAFDRIHLATCWSRLGRVNPADRKLLQANDGARLLALREQTTERVHTFGAQGVANTVHAVSKLALQGTAWSGLWNAIERAALAVKSEFDPQGLSTTAWAFAASGQTAPALLDALAAEAANRIDEFNSQDLTNTAWAFATAGHAAPVLFDTIATEATRRVGDFNAQDLTNTAWAYATADHAAPVLLDAIAQEAERRLRGFRPQNLANTAWAFATAGHAAPALFDAIAAVAAGRLRDFSPQELANTAWAFATAGCAAPALFDAIAEEAARRVGDFNPQGLSNTAWAFATAGHAAPALFDTIAEEAARRASEFTPQGLANTAWAFATAGRVAPALFDAIAAEAARRVRDFNPQQLANTLWVFATAGHAAPALFDAIAAEASGRVRDFKPQELSNTAWAFATAGHSAPALFDAIAAETAEHIDEFSPQNLVNTAWAFAAADCLPIESSLFDQRFARRCEALAHEFKSSELRQLHQWRLWYASERACSDALPEEALLARCAAAFRDAEAQPSRLQRQVAETLVSLGASVEEEVVLEEGYSLDVVVDWRGERLAVEVDGPSHFVGREPTGATALKRRQLKHFGWRLVSVPYWEWNELDDPENKMEGNRLAAYLSALLSGAHADD